MSLKEYKESDNRLSDWLPWGALIRSHLMMNKDRSMMATFSYTEMLKGESAQLSISSLCRNLQKMNSGWSIFSELVHLDVGVDRYYLTICWSPSYPKITITSEQLERSEKQLEIINIEKFNQVLNLLEADLKIICNASLLQGEEYLNYLRSTIILVGNAIAVPAVPMYLDALLTQDVSINSSLAGIAINDHHYSLVLVNGAWSEEIYSALEKLQSYKCAFRMVSRFVFFSEEDAVKYIEKYSANWCEGRNIMMGLLFPEKGDETAGLLSTSFVAYGKDEKESVKNARYIEKTLNATGIPCYFEKNRVMDAWYGTLPGMVRNNPASPILFLKDISEIICMP